MPNFHRPNAGFTLLEVLLAISVIAILAGLSFTAYTSLATEGRLDSSVRLSASLMRKAMALSEAGERDSMWGIHFSASTVTIFKGETMVSRDTAFDETVGLSALILSGQEEFVFRKGTGIPISAGTTTFTAASGSIRHLIINEKGTITIR